ncbi:TPA: HAD family hydrolase [Enterococcus faecium]|uniref:HAD family hydrolase n=1 Tax=Enterococcus faecium TaxID=1352 RepID=UPI000989A1EC|nr:HAD family phosphatase [Enterococcus faecium]SJX71179.1 HAD-superfamily hydrolase, subfamily IA, variant 3:HAD-superfamily hydrolase, subfamily IA, variant 1 [Enterococcus faecium]
MSLGVIFDMDGVLVDSESFYFERRMNFFKEKNLTPGSANRLDYVGLTENDIWEVLASSREDRNKLRKEYHEYRDKHPIDFSKALRNKAKEVLLFLKKEKIKVALASSSPKKEINEMLMQNTLMSYFDFIISGEDLSKSKPHPEIYQIAIAALDCDHYIAVEDSPVGIQAAKSAGLYTLALKQDFPLNQTQADIVIENITDVIKIIEERSIY